MWFLAYKGELLKLKQYIHSMLLLYMMTKLSHCI